MTAIDPAPRAARMVPTSTHLSSPGWVLVGSAGLYAADCMRPGCIWTATASRAEVVDAAAERHDQTEHPEAYS